MKRKAFTLVEGVVVVAILVILAAILLPVLQPRPARFYAVRIAPQHFRNTELSTVISQLDAARRSARAKEGKKSFDYLSRAVWSNAALKHRLISLDTSEEQPLKAVLYQLEMSAHIRFDYGGWCGTCGEPMGRLRILDTSSKAARAK